MSARPSGPDSAHTQVGGADDHMSTSDFKIKVKFKSEQKIIFKKPNNENQEQINVSFWNKDLIHLYSAANI